MKYVKFLGLVCLPFLAIGCHDGHTPSAHNDNYVTAPNTSVKMYVLDNDYGYDLAVSVINEPLHGDLIVDNFDRSVTYVPAPGFVGYDQFDYAAVDRYGRHSPATVSLDVGGY